MEKILESFNYLVASSSIYVDSYGAYFRVAGVKSNEVGTNYSYLCGSGAVNCNEQGNMGLRNVRPIVIIPSNIKVNQKESGQWDIAY